MKPDGTIQRPRFHPEACRSLGEQLPRLRLPKPVYTQGSRHEALDHHVRLGLGYDTCLHEEGRPGERAEPRHRLPGPLHDGIVGLLPEQRRRRDTDLGSRKKREPLVDPDSAQTCRAREPAPVVEDVDGEALGTTGVIHDPEQVGPAVGVRARAECPVPVQDPHNTGPVCAQRVGGVECAEGRESGNSTGEPQSPGSPRPVTTAFRNVWR